MNEIHIIGIFSRPGSHSGLQDADDLWTKCQAKEQSESAVSTSPLTLAPYSKVINTL